MSRHEWTVFELLELRSVLSNCAIEGNRLAIEMLGEVNAKLGRARIDEDEAWGLLGAHQLGDPFPDG